MDGRLTQDELVALRARRRLRLRRRGRKAYIRSVYFLPSMATLGNAVCGFGAIYVAHLGTMQQGLVYDPLTQLFAQHRFMAACLLLLFAMLLDALDGRLARWARHTTDFGGQLDSMADVVSFGVAPAMICLALFKDSMPDVPPFVSRLVWAIGAMYMSCAAIRLARFNVSNEHGEQAHMSFLGLPSPGAAAAVIGLVMVQQHVVADAVSYNSATLQGISTFLICLTPAMLLGAGLLMVSNFRYGHLINQYLRGKKRISKLIGALFLLVLLVIDPRYTTGIASIIYAASAPAWWLYNRYRPRPSTTSV